MSIARITTQYAPDVYKSINGIVLIHKPANFGFKQLTQEIRHRLTEGLNELEPRPLGTILIPDAEGQPNKTQLVEKPDLSDHPLVVGPRYLPWELSVLPFRPTLSFRSSGVTAFVLGHACTRYKTRIESRKLVNVYHLTGKFGYMTSNCFSDGKIMDKTKYDHIRPAKLDRVLSRIETSQSQRLFDSSNVVLSSQEAYELAKNWPSRPPKMAHWPVIYRVRCIHLKLPVFKLEVTVVNETDEFLSQLVHEVGIMNRTTAYTESIRRVKLGIFTIDDCLTDRDWHLQSFMDNINMQEKRRSQIEEMFKQTRLATTVREEYKQETIRSETHENNRRINVDTHI